MDPSTDSTPVATCPVFVPPHMIIGGSDIAKTAFEGFSADMREVTARSLSNARAWDQIAQDSARRSLDFYSLVSFNAAVAGQTGDTSNQQTTSPVRTGAADNVAAGATPANRITDETGAVAGGAVESATAQATLANVTAQVGELAAQVSSLTALVAQLVQNAKQPNPSPAA